MDDPSTRRVPVDAVFISAAITLFSSSIAFESSSSVASFSAGTSSRLDCFTTKNVVFPALDVVHSAYSQESTHEDEPYTFCVISPFSARATRIFCVVALGTAPLRFAQTSTIRGCCSAVSLFAVDFLGARTRSEGPVHLSIRSA